MAKRATTSKKRKPAKVAKAPKKAATRSKTAKASKRKKTTKKKSSQASDQQVTIDRRRGKRRDDDRSEEAPTAEAPKLERRKKVSRRRQIDPTTCERDYSQEEIEFMAALDDYKRANGRMFPTCSEVLEVIRKLGYVKLTAAESAQLPDPVAQADEEQPSFDEENFDDDMAEMATVSSDAY